MGQTLEHGIFLPDEGERNCYSGLAENWVALDTLVGAYSSHYQNTTIHVTASDKQTWNGKQDALSQTQLDAVNSGINSTKVQQIATNTSDISSLQSGKANDSDVVHKSGNETISGAKTFSDTATFVSVNLEDIRWKSLENQTIDLNDCYIPRAGAMSGYYTKDISSGSNISNKAANTSFILISLTTRRVSASDYNIRQEFYSSGEKYIRTCSNGTWTAWINETDKFVTTDTAQTISGNKTFSSNVNVYNSDDTANVPAINLKNSKAEISSSENTVSAQDISFLDKNSTLYANIKGAVQSNGSVIRIRSIAKDSSNNSVVNELQVLAYTNGNKAFVPAYSNEVDLGISTYKWKSICATNYYYGSNNVEFSTKFVTTDTAQTISETKTFTNTIKIKKEIELTGNRLAYILPEFSAGYSGLSLCTYGSNGAVKIGAWKVDDNDNTKHVLNDSLGYLNISTGSSNSVNIVYLTPKNASKAKLGDSVNKWHEVNGVEPSSLSLPDIANKIDISSYITNLNNVNNEYTPSVNGWISIRSTNATKISILDKVTSIGNTSILNTATYLSVTTPVVANRPVYITVMCTSLSHAYFIPCQGNV